MAENDEEYSAIVVDLAAVDTCLVGNSGEFYYVTKLACYNCSIIYDLDTHRKYAVRWDQTQTGRGANESASSLHYYISERMPKSTKYLFIWADTCGGQNRNYITVSAMAGIVKTHPNLLSVSLNYFESGHNQSEVDTIHSDIEKAVRRKEIYHPSEYVVLTSNAPPLNPIHVIELTKDAKFLILKHIQNFS